MRPTDTKSNCVDAKEWTKEDRKPPSRKQQKSRRNRKETNLHRISQGLEVDVPISSSYPKSPLAFNQYDRLIK